MKTLCHTSLLSINIQRYDMSYIVLLHSVLLDISVIESPDGN